ncbi:MAG: helix-turn-helix domain-containing protein [Bacteroidetes bacterium]|nr:helix-turn-helix domain-containing protein [Bacteroidota bacterium]
MGYHIAKPSYPLSLFVKHYWAIDNCLPVGYKHIQRIVPNGLMELMFYLCDKPKALDETRNFSENTFLSGQQSGYYDILVTGKLSLFSVSFQPFGVKMFFDIPSNEFFDQSIPLKDLVKGMVNKLESGLFEANSFESKIRIVEKFLREQLRNNSREYETNRIAHSIALINNARGLITVEQLSSASCLSRKQYERTFLKYIGAPPKQFLRTIRFQNTLHEKQHNRNMSLTELAYNCGYYDQSHMINEYKIFSGKTPTQYFNECEPYSDYFL